MTSDAVLLISHDVVGKRMAGPGIRFYNIARVLSRELPVTLAIPNDTEDDLPLNTFRVVPYHRGDWVSIQTAVDHASVVICSSDTASDFPKLGETDVPLVIDGYDPLWAEWLTLTQSDPSSQEKYWQARLSDLNRQFLLADFFVCASERQRDWWLGLLESSGRINPYTFRDDPSLRKLIDVVPYGLPENSLRPTRPTIKGVWNGIEKNDRVILWGGGLWPWLDPLTAIRAFARIFDQKPNARLIFPGTQHPNPILNGISTHNDNAKALAKELGLLNRAVYFGDWVPYEDWQNVLGESDAALTLHGDETIESHLAFRSRVLDYIWAGLPIVATRGDATSDLIAQYELGILVTSKDVEEVAGALLRLLDTPRDFFEKKFAAARKELTWERAVEPLIQFCRAPHRAPDKIALGQGIGNPFYLAINEQLKAEFAFLNAQSQSEITRLQITLDQTELVRDQFRAGMDRLNALVLEYQGRRAVRFANWLKGIFRKLTK